MTDFARLGIEIDSRQAKAAAVDLAIRSLTSTGIGLIDKAATADVSPQILQAAQDTANLMVDNNELLKSIDARLAGLNDNTSTGQSWFDSSRNFIAVSAGAR